MRAHRPTASIAPSQQVSGMLPEWRKNAAKFIPNANKCPSSFNSQVSALQKAKQSQQPSKYNSQCPFYLPIVCFSCPIGDQSAQ